ncbi:MAG: DUF3108 domain-containing protein [Nitrospira sp.]|nr:DUF3108 domain-containing protein [Nitrospira sp.]
MGIACIRRRAFLIGMGGLLLGCLWGVGFVPVALAVQADEDFRYAISLWGMPAGHATMATEALVAADGVPARRLVTTIRSNDFISAFFPVRNHVDSLVDLRSMLPSRLVFQRREGGRHERFAVTFDRVANQVTVLKDGKPSVHDVPPGTHGPLSCLYFLRTMPNLEPGSSVYLDIHHDRKNYKVEVKIESIESISGSWGEVETIRLLVIMPFRGIFLNEGNIRIWVTNTPERVPVMMEARVVVGSAKAVIEGWVPSKN